MLGYQFLILAKTHQCWSFDESLDTIEEAPASLGRGARGRGRGSIGRGFRQIIDSTENQSPNDEPKAPNTRSKSISLGRGPPPIALAKSGISRGQGWNIVSPNPVEVIYEVSQPAEASSTSQPASTSDEMEERALSVLKKVTPNPSTSNAADTQCKRPSPPKITPAA